MKRRQWLVSAFLLVVLAATPVAALEEADRLYLVGQNAVGDGLNALAARALERFVTEFPNDTRVPTAILMLGRAWLGVGLHERALESFRKLQQMTPQPGRPNEARLLEAEALFRLKRFAEARSVYDDVFRADPTAAIAPDALYGLAWTELESKRPENASKYFRELIATWPDHTLAPSATLALGRALVDAKRYADATPVLVDFQTKYPKHALQPEAQYLLGVSRMRGGDRSGVADLRAFVDANPNHELAADARRMIAGGAVATAPSTPSTPAAPSTPSTPSAPSAGSSTTADELYEAATTAVAAGRVKEQETALRRLRKEFPTHPLGRRAALDLANIAFKRKEWKDAATLARVAAPSEDEGVRAEAWLLAGEAELKLKRYPEAAKAFEGVGAVDGIDASIRYRALAGLGLAHEEQQHLRPALTAYEAVAGKSPDASLREWAQERAKAVRARLAKTPASKPSEGKSGDKPKGKS